MEKNWYVVHTYSGYENKVKANLENVWNQWECRIKFSALSSLKKKRLILRTARKSSQKKVFPGYVLVEIVMTDDSWYVVRNTPGVTGFVGSAGSGSKPTPLLPGEAETILKRMGMDERKTDIDFELNETVKVIDGPFANFTGSIEEIDYDKSKVKVFVNMFGRETPVELEFTQIDKL
ncbi:transcription termination/antitermination protein NusG [Bacillus velezensis]|nr:transcription termination/antitermination protein NusG [Bacillus velezensis]